jgi:cathepsin A (carboxypeptidase C)
MRVSIIIVFFEKYKFLKKEIIVCFRLCLVKNASNIETNPFSFSNIANILYIDQVIVKPYSFIKKILIQKIKPTDVGYSYTKGKKTRTSEQVSDSIYWFLQSFFTEFKQFSNNQFHIAGTSYGKNKSHLTVKGKITYLFFTASHFVPSLATRVIRENRYATSNGKIPIQLASIIIGNGYIHPQSHQLSYADYACDNNNNNQRKYLSATSNPFF